MTIQQIYENYIYSRSTYCSKETIKKYSDDLRLFFRFLKHRYSISIQDAGFDVLAGNFLREKQLLVRHEQ